MILTDAGPLIALIDRGERAHEACVAALSGLHGPMITTWPAFTEAMYLLGAAAAWPGQAAVWRLVSRGDLELADVSDPESLAQIEALMEQYRDLPMDLADASLVRAADLLETDVIFTLDRHFHVYRRAGNRSFELVPSRA